MKKSCFESEEHEKWQRTWFCRACETITNAKSKFSHERSSTDEMKKTLYRMNSELTDKAEKFNGPDFYQ